nr:hypothetical protein Iba_chr06bCG14740 [Ipomoea batatas]GMD09588.1 hypothetical protein Iba_chr06dCG9620 [Ipomoea batatas]GME03065.1 hypothetical protein Iba_scaffold446CG0130 [Ipomoea batatas]
MEKTMLHMPCYHLENSVNTMYMMITSLPQETQDSWQMLQESSQNVYEPLQSNVSLLTEPVLQLHHQQWQIAECTICEYP